MLMSRNQTKPLRGDKEVGSRHQTSKALSLSMNIRTSLLSHRGGTLSPATDGLTPTEPWSQYDWVRRGKHEDWGKKTAAFPTPTACVCQEARIHGYLHQNRHFLLCRLNLKLCKNRCRKTKKRFRHYIRNNPCLKNSLLFFASKISAPFVSKKKKKGLLLND